MHAYSGKREIDGRFFIAALLDSLLGADRNELPNSANAKKRTFRDPEICKYYLVAFCPHDLFPNTKSHLGPCPRIHDEFIKDSYDRSPDKERYAPEFEEEMISFLKQLIAQAEQKIDKANRRIDAPLPESALLTEEQQKLIDSMNEKISKLLHDAELAGDRGDVEEAANLNRQVQALKREIERAGSLVYGSYMQREKSLRVCSICGAMQSVGDSMSRFESHVTGKMHLGYEKIRACLEELLRRKAEREERGPPHMSGESLSATASSSVEDHQMRSDRRSNDSSRSRPGIGYNHGGGGSSYRNGGSYNSTSNYGPAPPNSGFRRRSNSISDGPSSMPPPRRSYGRDHPPYSRPNEEPRRYRNDYGRNDIPPPPPYRDGGDARRSHWKQETPSPTREEGEAVEEGEYLPPR